MGLFRRSARYDEPIKNGFADFFYELWGGVPLRERKRRERRDRRHAAMRWWYHPDEPHKGLRAVLILIGLLLAGVLVVQQRVVGAQVCLHQVGCVYTEDGGVNASGHAEAPKVVQP